MVFSAHLRVSLDRFLVSCFERLHALLHGLTLEVDVMHGLLARDHRIAGHFVVSLHGLRVREGRQRRQLLLVVGLTHVLLLNSALIAARGNRAIVVIRNAGLPVQLALLSLDVRELQVRRR